MHVARMHQGLCQQRVPNQRIVAIRGQTKSVGFSNERCFVREAQVFQSKLLRTTDCEQPLMRLEHNFCSLWGKSCGLRMLFSNSARSGTTDTFGFEAPKVTLTMNTLASLGSLSDAVGTLLPTSNAPRRKDHDWVKAAREQADSHQQSSNECLVQLTRGLQQRVQSGADPASKQVLIEGFALVTESARRVLGISYYDVQLLAGLALSRGRIAEMQTGEGKTFVAALPAFIHALHGEGVHVLTVNDYLAQRDFEQMGPVFELLGMSAGFLKPSASPDDKRAAYACDITYGPGYEFGFDYLRDQAAMLNQRRPRLGERFSKRLRGEQESAVASIQRPFHFCVIDEIDSVLIDEATTPLLLSEGAPDRLPDNTAFLIAKETAESLTADRDYLMDAKGQRVSLTSEGIQTIAEAGELAAGHVLLRPWSLYVRQALHAERLLKRDVDYVVDEKEQTVLLVDKNTGRIFPDRCWRDGLHQAVQAKEGLPITPEQQPVGHITRQRFFQLYPGRCGMTGTAAGNESELQYFYRLPITVIPTRKRNRRLSLTTRYFADTTTKSAAIIDEVQRVHATGQPILVGTRTIEISEAFAEQLGEKQIPFCLLNGKQDDEEASIIARAGEVGAVTIATNMAGRGTDIKLGPGAERLGGLHVIGTERHESPRVDRQLVGRAARQGDPGSYQFFVAADDQLVAMYAPALVNRLKRSDVDGEVTTDISGEIAKLQRKVEQLHFEQRKQMFAHDRWLDQVLSTLAEE